MKIKGILLFAIAFCYLLSVKSVGAVGGSISVNPLNGQFKSGDILSVVVSVDGGGIPFNAAKADIYPSPNFQVEDVILGNCDFAFVTTPTKSSLSFAGVILGDSKDACNVYTMRLKALGPGDGNLLVSDGSIKAFQGAHEIIGTVKGGAYSVLGESLIVGNVVSDEKPIVTGNGKNTYTIFYSVKFSANAGDVAAFLDKGAASQKTAHLTSSFEDKDKYTVQFDNVEEGIHVLTIESGGRLIKSQVINAGGESKELAFGQIIGDESSKQLFLYASVIVGITATLVGGAIIYLVWNRMNSSVY